MKEDTEGSTGDIACTVTNFLVFCWLKDDSMVGSDVVQFRLAILSKFLQIKSDIANKSFNVSAIPFLSVRNQYSPLLGFPRLYSPRFPSHPLSMYSDDDDLCSAFHILIANGRWRIM